MDTALPTAAPIYIRTEKPQILSVIKIPAPASFKIPTTLALLEYIETASSISAAINELQTLNGANAETRELETILAPQTTIFAESADLVTQAPNGANAETRGVETISSPPTTTFAECSNSSNRNGSAATTTTTTTFAESAALDTTTIHQPQTPNGANAETRGVETISSPPTTTFAESADLETQTPNGATAETNELVTTLESSSPSVAPLPIKTLRKHEKQKRANAKTIVCETCSKLFSTAHKLKIHTNTHTGEKPYSCPDCTRPFADRSNLRKHSYICKKKIRITPVTSETLD